MSPATVFLKTARPRGRHLVTLAVSLILCAGALPALAQQQSPPSNPGPGYGHGPMMWGWGGGPGWGWHPFMMIGPVIGLLVIVGIMAIFIGLVRWATHGHILHPHGPYSRFGYRDRSALDILEERFAKGEIDKAEFEEKRKLLSR